MEKSQSRKRLKLQATGAIHVWKRPLLFAMRKAKNFRGSQLKRPDPSIGIVGGGAPPPKKKKKYQN